MATSSSLPTVYHGHIQESWYSALGDWQEQIGDLVWPLSNYTYGQMRRDAQLSAVISAYTLPIRRASWALNPAGCRPEVVKLVADDLGLPVMGVDEPGAARVRGVSWAEHLRSALLHLVYGHYGFELLAKVNTRGEARLVGLSDRIPVTITNLHVDDQGEFLGISQDNRFFDNPPQIGADRLAWYCHDREGAMWQGRSLLRPSFAPWLLKRECQRILGTSARRFGMGVPTLRALPGTVATPEQMAAAATVAQQMRGGETAGAAIPPGFVVELLGLQGSAPDTLAFLKWLDQQMSKSALAQFLDLGGESAHGSRSLGTAFIDLFTLSIAAVAEYCADIATRQIAARIVDWNWGEDEPVPAITVSDVGTKHEITADAIQQLVSVGAIQPDPELDSYLRGTFQLPQRSPSVPWERPPAKTTSVSPADDTKVAAAKPRRARKTVTPGQMALPIATDDQTDDRDQATTAAAAAITPLLATAAATLATTAAQLVTSQQAASLPSLTIDQSTIDQIAAALTATMDDLASTAANQAAVELNTVGATAPADPGDSDTLEQAAVVAAAVIAARLATAAAQTAIGRSGASRDQVETAVKTDLDAQIAATGGWLAGTVGGAMLTAQHTARMATLAHADGAVRYKSDEPGGPSSCKPCDDIAGTIYDSFAAASADYVSGGYIGCLGGLRCRGTIVPIAK